MLFQWAIALQVQIFPLETLSLRKIKWFSFPEDLSSKKRYPEAARVLLDYSKDVRQAIIALVQGHNFSEARRIVSIFVHQVFFLLTSSSRQLYLGHLSSSQKLYTQPLLKVVFNSRKISTI
jgi:choline-glycine betaine transporter